MRPYLDAIIEEHGIEGAIEFLRGIKEGGVHLAKRETDALAQLLFELSEKFKDIVQEGKK